MIKTDLLNYIHLSNPWLKNKDYPIFLSSHYIPRLQTTHLLNPTGDKFITVLTGPRQAGKTTLGRYISQQLINEKRFANFIYLNCDESLVREWLTGSHVLVDLQRIVGTSSFILFLDEVQRLENPGLLLKSIYDLHLPIKIIATGSSQLEIKSKVQEHLTGRQLESIILPLSYAELGDKFDVFFNTIYGCYPQIVLEKETSLVLNSLYQNYINKDIIEILKVRHSDTLQQLLVLIAHSSGQLVNYQQLATDCKVSSHTIQHYLSILENTYVLCSVKPFVGNKRTEITSNPIYYFIDNGFRNQALNNFSSLENRTDNGLLIQSAVFQEIFKFKIQHYIQLNIYYWRTKGGAEVDFVLYENENRFIPIEVKYRHLNTDSISRGFRSFLKAYSPPMGMVITKDFYAETDIENSKIYFIPFSDLQKCLAILLSTLVCKNAN